MKKKLGIVILMLMMMCIVSKELTASTFSNYLPGGKNYIEEANFEVTANSFSSIDDIYIKKNTTYTISFPGDVLLEFPEIFISTDNNVVFDDNVEDISSCSMDSEETICTFETDSNDSYLEIIYVAHGVDIYYSHYGMNDIQLEEGSVKTEYEEYVRPLVDVNSPEFNGVGAYVISYSDDTTINEIINSHIVVIDDIDGNITENVTILSDNFTPNRNEVGEYIVELKATDQGNNSAYFTLTVIVKDEIDAVIEGPSSLSVSFNSTLDITTIISDNYTALDGHDGSLVLTIQTDDYTTNKTELGTYSVVLTAEDSSGNVVDKAIEVNVVDQNSPILESSDQITVYHSSPKSIEDIVNMLVFTDDYNDSNEILKDIISNTYTISDNAPGQYIVSVKATDTSGNSSLFDITINTIDDVYPTISGPVYFEFSYTTPKTLEEIMNTIVVDDNYSSLNINDIVVVSDSYSTRTEQVGTFYLLVEIEDSSYNKTTRQIQIDVIDDQVPVIYVDNITITVSENATFNEQDALNMLVKNNELPDENYVITVLNDEYTGNEQLPGTYLYSLRFDDEDGNTLQKDFTIEVPEESNTTLDRQLIRNIAIYGVSVLFLLFVIIKRKK